MKRAGLALWRLCRSLIVYMVLAPVVVVWAKNSIPVTQLKLENGLTVIIQPGPQTGAALQMVWVKVGSVDEHNGTTGVAHVLEHMMFKGSQLSLPGEFSKKVARLGGIENAFTSEEFTAYFQHVPASNLEQVMMLEGDRLSTNRFTDDEFLKEIEVVKEERRMRTEDSPRARLRELLMANAMTSSPYRRPVIGWMSDLESMTADDVRQFYQRWYRPSNSAVVVVGDVDVNRVKVWAEKYYGAWKNAPVVPTKPQHEPPQEGIRRVTLEAAVDQPYLSMAFRIPAIQKSADLLGDNDVFALTVLAGVLNGHEGARLNKALTEGPLAVAQSVSAYNGTLNRSGPNFFYVQAALVPGQSMADLEAGIRKQIQLIATDGVPPEELNRVKTMWIASRVFESDSLREQANELGFNWVLGFEHDAQERLLDRIGQVTADQVKAVAAKYFGDKQLTVAQLLASGKQAPERPIRLPVLGRHP